jgi:hypothetical protein
VRDGADRKATFALALAMTALARMRRHRRAGAS